MDDKNNMVIPIVAQKAFVKIQHPFFEKKQNSKTSNRRRFLNLKKSIYEKPMSCFILW
jgi:hypothetical protein